MTLTPHKHKDAIIAFAHGHKIEVRSGSSEPWKLVEWPAFDESNQYRVYDEFRELKEAHASGKRIQYKTYIFDPELTAATRKIHWETINHPHFDGDVGNYRIMPEEITAARVAFESDHKVVMVFGDRELVFNRTEHPNFVQIFTPYYNSVPDGAKFKILPKKRKHIHAELMMEYAKDAMETDTPWKRWEFRNMKGEWVSLMQHPAWQPGVEYRKIKES